MDLPGQAPIGRLVQVLLVRAQLVRGPAGLVDRRLAGDGRLEDLLDQVDVRKLRVGVRARQLDLAEVRPALEQHVERGPAGRRLAAHEREQVHEVGRRPADRAAVLARARAERAEQRLPARDRVGGGRHGRGTHHRGRGADERVPVLAEERERHRRGLLRAGEDGVGRARRERGGHRSDERRAAQPDDVLRGAHAGRRECVHRLQAADVGREAVATLHVLEPSRQGRHVRDSLDRRVPVLLQIAVDVGGEREVRAVVEEGEQLGLVLRPASAQAGDDRGRREGALDRRPQRGGVGMGALGRRLPGHGGRHAAALHEREPVLLAEGRQVLHGRDLLRPGLLLEQLDHRHVAAGERAQLQGELELGHLLRSDAVLLLQRATSTRSSVPDAGRSA